MLLETMRHAVAEAAIAIDDVEGWWYQDRDLEPQQIAKLNDEIRERRASIIQQGGTRWLITLGRGFTYLVEPMERCSECLQLLWVDEAVLPYPVHSACYDPAAWAFQD